MKVRALLFCVAVAGAACGLRNQKPMAVPPRAKDSASERHDSMKNLPPPVGLQADEDRWGVEKSKEMKRIKTENQAKSQSSGALIPMPAANPENDAAAGRRDGGASPADASTYRYMIK